MRKFTTILFFILVTISTAVVGQTNSWINYSQKYVRVGVSVKGLQKVTFAQLNTAQLGLDAGNVNRLQLFHRGKEVSIISTDNNEVIFYGELNDGASDSLLYRPHSARMNPHYSLYSDEGAYFFTIGGGNGKRTETINQPVDNNLIPVPWHWEKSLTVFKNEYSIMPLPSRNTPTPMQSFPRNGETYTSTPTTGTGTRSISIPMTNRYTATYISPVLTAMVNGRYAGNNTINVTIGQGSRTLFTFNTLGFVGQTLSASSILSTDINNNALPVKFTSTNSTGNFSLTYYQLEYPQLLRMGTSPKWFNLPEVDNNWSLIRIENTPQSNLYLIDISDLTNLKLIQHSPVSGSTIQAMLPRSSNKKSTLLASSSVQAVTNVKTANFQNISPNNFNYLIITNNTLKAESEAYGTYRSSPVGGNYKPLVVDIADVYNQFNYGEPSPVAIRHFAKFMVSDNNYNKFLFLVGASTTAPVNIIKELKGVIDKNTAYANYWHIPAIGYPGSDVLLVDKLDENGKVNVPSIPVGRLNAYLPEHVSSYLNKVISYENPNLAQDWKKNVIHLSGGGKGGGSEINQLRNTLNNLNPIVEDGFLGGKVSSFSKDPNSFVINDDIDLSENFNSGIGMLTFYGHGAAGYTDYNFGYLSTNPNILNSTKTPFIYFNGCGVNNIFSGRYNSTVGHTYRFALSTDWILTPNRGAIAVLSNSFDSYLSTANRYLKEIYNYMFLDDNILPIGEIQKLAAIKITSETHGDFDIANLHQSVLQGDPALIIGQLETADYVVDKEKSIFLYSGNNSTPIGQSNDIKIGIDLTNKGKFSKSQPLNVSVKITYNNNSTALTSQSVPSVAIRDTVFIPFNITDTGGRTLSISDVRKIDVVVNPLNNPVENNLDNNSGYVNLNWQKMQGLMYWNNDSEALPVTLTGFEAKNENNSALLTWTTISEINFEGFEVQKSNDGKNWIKLGYVDAKLSGNSFAQYSFNDHIPFNGENLYRLKMIDLDKSYEYSKINSLIIDLPESISIWPNPTSDIINVSSNTNEKIDYIEIVNVSGNILLKREAQGQDQINLKHLKTGVYILNIYQNNKPKYSYKILKN